MFEGRLENALKKLEHCAGSDPHGLKSGDNCLSNEALRAEILFEKGREQEALRNFETALDIYGKTFGDEFLRRPITHVRLLAATDLERARAFLEELKAKIDRNPAGREYKYWYCRGYIELRENNPEAAIESLKRADESTDLFYVRYQLALAYLSAGQTNRAVETFETVIRSHTNDRVRFGLWNAKARYYCGLALLESGDQAGAEAKFTEFLDLWNEADWGFGELTMAKNHLTRLSLNQRTADRGN
jgi:tetratricopeptide (TPR) repeat protein